MEAARADEARASASKLAAASPRRTNPTRLPLATAAVVGALWLAFELEHRARAPTGVGADELPGRWVFDGASPRWWHFVSYAFVHDDARHLAGNLAFIALAGLAVEQHLGAKRTLAAALALCALAAAGFHLADPRDLYGASGLAAGLVALAGALGPAAPRARWYARVVPPAAAALFFALTEVLPALAGRPNPGWHAHVPGALAGLVLGVALSLREARRNRGVQHRA